MRLEEVCKFEASVRKTRDVESHSSAGKNILWGPTEEKNLIFFAFKMAHSGVLYLFERRRLFSSKCQVSGVA